MENALKNLFKRLLIMVIVFVITLGIVVWRKVFIPKDQKQIQKQEKVVHQQSGTKRKPYSTEFCKEEFIVNPLDKLERSVSAEIVLCGAPEVEDRPEKIDTNPMGWRNYKVEGINPKTKEKVQYWAFNRTHLIGYQFSGDNTSKGNLINGTTYLNTGAVKGTDTTNKEGMLYYEMRLADLLKKYELGKIKFEYKVQANYRDDKKSMIPETVTMKWRAKERDAKNYLDLSFKVAKLNDEGFYEVTLENKDKNLFINYTTNEVQAVGKLLQTTK